MKITYDPHKNASNIEKHGLSFEDVQTLEWDEAYTWVDDRFDYSEVRVSVLVPRGPNLFSSLTLTARTEGASLPSERLMTGRKNAMRKTIKTRSGRILYLNTPEEDAAITAAAMSDPDSIPLTDEEWEEVEKTGRVGRRGRPKSDTTKEHITLRVDADIVAAFRASGSGWQSRINDILRANMPHS